MSHLGSRCGLSLAGRFGIASRGYRHALVCPRGFGSSTSRHERHEYNLHFKTLPRRLLPSDFLKVPIHSQDTKQLVNTIVT
ncbi:uncharacterized protein BdWA1_004164, partial [Babesia duncani]